MVSERISALAAAMRARGARVGVGEVMGAHRALAAVDCANPVDGRLALRAALCSTRAELAIFDEAWAEAFPSAKAPGPLDHLDPITQGLLPQIGVPDLAGPQDDLELEPVPAAWSEVELLRHKDFAEYTEAELALAHRLLARLAHRGPRRVSRRATPPRRRAGG